MTDLLEMKMKKLRANRRSYHKHTKSAHNPHMDGEYDDEDEEMSLFQGRSSHQYMQ